MLVLVAGFLALGWWQILRARSGNMISYGYSFEWPAFAVFTVWVWLVEVRKALRPPEAVAGVDASAEEPAVPTRELAPAVPARAPRRRTRSAAAYDDSDDPQLAAYNHYLAWLNANPQRNPADYPGLPMIDVKGSTQ
jgi:hypothetical protein